MNTLLLASSLVLMISCSLRESDNSLNDTVSVMLPPPDRTGNISLEETIQNRRSVRTYSDQALSLADLGQLAWAAQGITDEMSGFRAAPSAGATFPLNIYFLVTGLEQISDGYYQYGNKSHSLTLLSTKDKRRLLRSVALGQDAIVDAPVVMVITGILERISRRYGNRSLRYMHMEAGHVAQNVYLQATARNMGTVVIGAFDDEQVNSLLQLDDGEYPLYIMPLGKMN